MEKSSRFILQKHDKAARVALVLGLVHDSAGDWLPPGLPSIEQGFGDVGGFLGALKMALIGRVVLLANVLLVNRNELP